VNDLPLLTGYSPELRQQASALLESGRLAQVLAKRYPNGHEVNSNKALNTYVQELKSRHMKTAPPLAQVLFDNQLHHAHNALGIHRTSTRVQGTKLRKRREVRVASLFKETPPEFLRMIVVHELAHMKHQEHNAAFYKLCVHMESDYHQYELDLRLLLTAQEWKREDGSGKADSSGPGDPRASQ
jgi:predicted metal-dependent hydrolase